MIRRWPGWSVLTIKIITLLCYGDSCLATDDRPTRASQWPTKLFATPNAIVKPVPALVRL